MFFKRIIYIPIFLATFLALTGCGKGRLVSPELLPYVQSFEQRYRIFFNGNILFKELKDPQAGVCVFSWNTGTLKNNIYINPKYFNKYNDDGKEFLVYHELGHCAMYLYHNTSMNNQCPKSIMYPFINQTILNCFSNNKSYYYNELGM